MLKKSQIWFSLSIVSLWALAACASPATAIVSDDATPQAPTDTIPAVEAVATEAESDATPLPATATPVANTAIPSEPPTTTPTALPDGWHAFTVDSERSEASYTVEEEFFSGAVQNLGKALGLFTAIGITDQVSGQLVLDLNGVPSVISGEIVVDISKLTSDDGKRDDRIRSEYLESSSFPLAVFVPTAIESFPGDVYEPGQEVTFELVGALTIREVTKTVTFEVTAIFEDGVLQGTASAMILMTDYGFDPPAISGFMQAENEALITITLLAVE
jgi:polyisoprenoid-binding protein YceI